MLKTTGLLKRSTSKELRVNDSEVVGFDVGGGNGSLNQKIV